MSDEPTNGIADRLALAEAQLVTYARDLRTVYQAERQRREALERAYHSTLLALCRALDLRDTETEEHSLRVVRYSLALGQALTLHPQDLADVELGAMLHDVGKIGIPDAILRKPGPLDEAEWAMMRRHPQLGYDILRGVEFLAPALPIVLHHHEKWNGGGYPHGLRGEEIPLAARIFAIADAFDAMISLRPYKKPFPPVEALARIRQDSGSHFDPELAAVFTRLFAELGPEALARPALLGYLRPKDASSTDARSVAAR
jgi:HD-GYP domain-containing protein (c-di-GMP phosphodiesterase class II)